MSLLFWLLLNPTFLHFFLIFYKQNKKTLLYYTNSFVVGIPTATVTIYPLVSWFCESGYLGGWPMAFYFPGTTG